MHDRVHVVCHNCQAVNRVPPERLGQAPKCGKCRQLLFTGEPVPLTSATLQRLIERNDYPVVVDFWAPWCGPCRTMAPEFASAAKQLEPSIRFARVDTEAEPAAGNRFGIRSIPTMILFHKGRERARQSGAMRAADIVSWVRRAAIPTDKTAG